MEVASVNQETVYLLPKNFSMKQPKDITLFTITRAIFVNDSSTEKGIRMKITLKRKIMSEMMTTYFPTFLLMMITFATTFFKPYFFEAALSVNLTTMLMMTTIFISKMEGLPPTSATKMIDYWLILCQLVPFAQVVLLTAIEYIREEESEECVELEDVKEPKSEKEEEPELKDTLKPPVKKTVSLTIVSILLVVGKLES